MQADQINENEMKLEFDARSVNEGFARMAVAAFVAELKEIRSISSLPAHWMRFLTLRQQFQRQ